MTDTWIKNESPFWMTNWENNSNIQDSSENHK